MTDSASVLRTSPLFTSLSDEDINKVAGIARTRTFGAGETMINEGDDSALGMWIILSGEVTVSSEGTTLATFGSGQHVGETALVTDAPRSADVVANVDTETLQITRWDLRGLIAEHPSIATGKEAAQHWRRTGGRERETTSEGGRR